MFLEVMKARDAIAKEGKDCCLAFVWRKKSESLRSEFL